ncbi:TPM domain-containing protein [Flavobacterium pedocola]
MTKKLLSNSEEHEIVQAIAAAEKKTSGEIRVHIEYGNKKPSFESAHKVFHELGMGDTDLKNGVLFFICVKSKSLIIIGDKGINDKVAPDFWEATKNNVLELFKQGLFKKGLVTGIEQAANQLQLFFPFEQENANELSNEISSY